MRPIGICTAVTPDPFDVREIHRKLRGKVKRRQLTLLRRIGKPGDAVEVLLCPGVPMFATREEARSYFGVGSVPDAFWREP